MTVPSCRAHSAQARMALTTRQLVFHNTKQEQTMQNTLVIITTGGTIAMRYDPVLGGAVPALTGQELVAAVPPLADLGTIEVVEFANIPSPHMTPALMLSLARKVETQLARPEVAGVVITHGTDTLEESAHLLDLYLDSEKPVCLTAAMRDASGLSPDGPANILCAALTALSPQAKGMGVMVVMNGEIHAARDVVKTHSSVVQTFASPFLGPLGHVDAGEVFFSRAPLHRQTLRPEKLAEDVTLLKLAAGADDFLIRCLVEKGVSAIVLEAPGRGNVPPAVLPGIQLALDKGIPVAVCTRCLGGRALGAYAYEGGGTSLQAMGVILCRLNGLKTRLTLMLALGLTKDKAELASYL